MHKPTGLTHPYPCGPHHTTLPARVVSWTLTQQCGEQAMTIGVCSQPASSMLTSARDWAPYRAAVPLAASAAVAAATLTFLLCHRACCDARQVHKPQSFCHLHAWVRCNHCEPSTSAAHLGGTPNTPFKWENLWVYTCLCGQHPPVPNEECIEAYAQQGSGASMFRCKSLGGHGSLASRIAGCKQQCTPRSYNTAASTAECKQRRNPRSCNTAASTQAC